MNLRLSVASAFLILTAVAGPALGQADLVDLAASNPNAFVAAVQQQLIHADRYSGAATGQLTKPTIRAINALCRDAGVSDACSLGPLTLEGSKAVVTALATLQPPEEVAIAEPSPEAAPAPEVAPVQAPESTPAVPAAQDQPTPEPVIAAAPEATPTPADGNLVINGNFDQNIDGWTPTPGTVISFVWQDGQLSVTRGTGSLDGAPAQPLTLTPGRTYELSLEVSGNKAAFQVAGSDHEYAGLGLGKQVVRIVAGKADSRLMFWANNENETTVIDNVSLREVE